MNDGGWLLRGENEEIKGDEGCNRTADRVILRIAVVGCLGQNLALC